MNPAIELIGVILLPTAVGYSLLGSARLYRWVAERRKTARFRVQEPVMAEPIERLAARMRRLRAELETLETRSDVQGKGVRLRATPRRLPRPAAGRLRAAGGRPAAAR